MSNGPASALRPDFLRLLAWTLLERDGPLKIGKLRFGRELSRRLADMRFGEREATATAAQVLVIAGGWALLEPALIAANDLNDEEVETVVRSLDELVESVLSSAAVASE